MSTIPELTTHFASAIDWHSGPLDLFDHATFSGPVLAQAVKSTLWSDVQSAWNNFVDSGQIWAMGLGILLGYWFRSMSVG